MSRPASWKIVVLLLDSQLADFTRGTHFPVLSSPSQILKVGLGLQKKTKKMFRIVEKEGGTLLRL